MPKTSPLSETQLTFLLFASGIVTETHPEILQTAMQGRWTQAYKDNATLKSALDKIRARATRVGYSHPHIYVNEFVDGRGRSPTPHQLLLVVDDMEVYYRDEDRQKARRFDRFRKPHPTPGDMKNPSFRKYVWKKKNAADKGFCKESRITRGLTFCTNLRKRIDALPAGMMNLPLDVPLVEVGETGDTEARLAAHSNHTNSNSIMNLFEAICDQRWPAKYGLSQFVVHTCCSSDRVALAEILFTHLCEGYISNAGGFSSHPAGISVEAAYKQNHKGWEEAMDWVREEMLMKQTMDTEMRLWKLQEADESDDDDLESALPLDPALVQYSTDEMYKKVSASLTEPDKPNTEASEGYREKSRILRMFMDALPSKQDQAGT